MAVERPDITPEMETELRPDSIRWRPFFVLYALPLLVVLCLLVWLSGSFSLLPERRTKYDMEAFESRIPFRYKGSFNRDFNDLNEIQLAVAKRIGVAPLVHRQDHKKHARELVEIRTNDLYVVEDLTHSIPFVVRPMAQLLEEIGERFRTSLSAKGMPMYRPIITSVMRTQEDVRNLRKSNTNATENSTHMYGTTIDISWKRFAKTDCDDPRDLPQEELKHLLAIILKELHDDGRCYIKHERKQACFHITVRV